MGGYGGKYMSKEEITEKLRINVGVGAAWGAIAFCVAGTAVAAASYVNILHRLDTIARESVTHTEFQSWVDTFRESNPATKVPAVPHQHTKNNSLAVAVISRNDETDP